MDTFYLEVSIKMSNNTRRWLFDTLEEAKQQLDLLSPKMGKSKYDYNEIDKDRLLTHTVIAKCGDGVVVIDEVQSAGVVIESEWRKEKEKANAAWLKFALEAKAAGIEIKN